MSKKIFLSICILCLWSGSSIAQDKLLDILKSELSAQTKELSDEKIAVYHINFRVVEKEVTALTSSFGATLAKNHTKNRIFVPQLRLGDPDFDNFKTSYMGASGPGGRYPSALLPLDENRGEAGVRQAMWQQTKSRYNFAKQAYITAQTNRQTRIAAEDKSPSFSPVKPVKYFEPALSADKSTYDIALWEKQLNNISSQFSNYPNILEGVASLTYIVERRYFVNSEGSEVAQNLTYARLMVQGKTKAEDGMELPLYLSYFAYVPEDLPSIETIIAETKVLSETLEKLRVAPVVDPFSGPALLSGEASGVFFHEIFGHRIEGQRMKLDGDGQTFKKMIGQLVLPESMQVFDDPSMKEFNGADLNGFYKFDDQGVIGERVDVVVNGKMNDFLMTRTPIDNHLTSNGHARADGGADPISRQSNLVIQTRDNLTEAQLRTLLLDEVKRQGKEYGFYFKEVTGGFTYTGKGQINSFNVTPLEVYQIFADGRPDQLVRGLDMIGTPLSMFSNITHAGGENQIFTGMCGAESGRIPVTAISPTILVKKVEVQRKATSNNPLPILKRPTIK